jgi:hypothetical protein
MSGEVRAQIRSFFPQSAQTWGPTPTGSDEQPDSVQFLVCARTAAEVDGLSVRVARLPGVDHVLLWYERASVPVREWLDDRIERILRTGGTGK